MLIKLSAAKGSTLVIIKKIKAQSIEKLEFAVKHGQAGRIDIVCLAGQLHAE